MALNARRPARFILKNSKGRPDFIMTMLVAVTLALFIVVMFWMVLNLLAFRMTVSGTANHGVIDLLGSFNENARLIVVGLASSVFSLAGAYYLRRSSFDTHYEKLLRTKNEILDKFSGASADSNYAAPGQSTLSHPNYDDGEEDI